MHITVRRFLFVFFVLVFVLAAPVVVLYTAGYRLNISNQRLLQTGVLAITTAPRNSTIALNGQSLTSKTPYVVQHLMPAVHNVTLHRQGYHEWSQRVRVNEGRTSYITARLFADSQPTLLNASNSALAMRARETPDLITVDQANVTFLHNGANVEIHTDNNISDELIALLPTNAYRVLEVDSEYLLIADERNAAFVIARQGGAVVELPTRLTAFDWLAEEDLLIWTDGTEVNIYNAVNNENTFITRDGQPTVDVAWHPDADSFFVATATTIDAYDYFVHETREVVSLLTDAAISDIWLDGSGKNLYYLDRLPIENSTEPTFVYQLQLTL